MRSAEIVLSMEIDQDGHEHVGVEVKMPVADHVALGMLEVAKVYFTGDMRAQEYDDE